MRKVNLAVVAEGEVHDLMALQKWAGYVDPEHPNVEKAWQVELEMGWKMMGEAESHQLTEALAELKKWTRIVHQWRNPCKGPSKGQVKKTIYSVDFSHMTQENADNKHKRNVRLVQLEAV